MEYKHEDKLGTKHFTGIAEEARIYWKSILYFTGGGENQEKSTITPTNEISTKLPRMTMILLVIHLHSSTPLPAFNNCFIFTLFYMLIVYTSSVYHLFFI
jgi:hypothetical protein